MDHIPEVAEYFGKRHDAVLRDIRNLLADLPPERRGLHNFVETPYIDAQNGQEYPMYRLDRRGFMLMAMGFTGSQALALKLDYLDAFDAAIGELNRLRKEKQSAQEKNRLPGISVNEYSPGDAIDQIIRNLIIHYTSVYGAFIEDKLEKELKETAEAYVRNYVDTMSGEILERAFGKLISKSIAEWQSAKPLRVELSPTAFGVLQHIAENREFYSEPHSSREMLEFGLPYEETACMLSQWLKLSGFSKGEKGFQLWLPVQWMGTPDFRNVTEKSVRPK